MNKTLNITISSGTIIKAIIFILLIVLLFTVRHLVGIILFSIVIASAIEPFTSWLQKRKLPRVISVILVYLFGFSVLGFLFYLIVPTLFREFADFAGLVPGYLNNPFDLLLVDNVLPNLPDVVSGLLSNLIEYLQGLLSVVGTGLLNATSSLAQNALSVALVIVLSFYLSVQDRGIEKFLRVVTPIQYEKYIIVLWARTRAKIGAWLQGQLLLGLIVGVLVYLGLTVLGVRYAFIFAMLAAVFELIPIFGPILSAIPPVGVALLTSPTLALYVIILYIIIQQIENNLIYPLVVTKAVGVPPMIIIISLIVGGQIAGFSGILLSVPVVTALMEVYNDVEERKIKQLEAHK